MLAGCGGGFRYETLAAPGAPSERVDWLTTEPSRPYTVIATFRGAETALCAPSQPYCSLREKAKQQGADAIWVQKRDEWTRPEQWVYIGGQLKRIPPQPYVTLEGALIRYR